MTFRRGSLERLSMTPSVMPWLRYSVSGSAFALTRGRTASDSMAAGASGGGGWRSKTPPRAMARSVAAESAADTTAARFLRTNFDER